MSKKAIIKEVDSLYEKIQKMEQESDDVVKYNILKEELEAGVAELRSVATEEGNFQTKFFKMIQKHKMVVEWKGIVSRLYEQKRLTDDDAEWIERDFTKETIFGEARKITTGDSEKEI